MYFGLNNFKYSFFTLFHSSYGIIKVPLRGDGTLAERLKRVNEDYNNYLDQGSHKIFMRYVKNFYGIFPMVILKALEDRFPGLQTVVSPINGSSETYFLNEVPIQSVYFFSSLQASQIGESGFLFY